MTKETILRGLTWDHTRGYAPLAATSQTFADRHPGVRIHWDIRSLAAFGEGGLAEVARDYDLVSVDHPFVGEIAAHDWFLPLEGEIPPDELAALRAASVGASYASYEWAGRLWALPIDAACHLSAAREDLLARDGLARPRTWDEVLHLAATTGKVAQPFNRMGCVTAFFSLCASAGESPMPAGSRAVVSRETGRMALDRLLALYRASGPNASGQNAVHVLNRLAHTDELYFSPCVFGYSNYSRDGYAPHRLSFDAIPGPGGGGTLGGVGLAVSSRRPHRPLALAYARWIAGEICQRTLYALAGGQPAHVAAWRDPLVNAVAHDFFRGTYAALERAYLRPCHAGFHAFQSAAADVLSDHLHQKQAAGETLAALDRAYAASLSPLN